MPPKLALGSRARQAENVCLMADVTDVSVPPVVKLIDLGFSKSTVAHSVANTMLGSPFYLAPEVYASGRALCLNKDPSYDKFKADTWALGVLLLIMLRYDFPFGGSHQIGVLMAIGDHLAATDRLHATLLEQVNNRTHASPEALAFLRKCFEEDPKKRLMPRDLLDDPWVKKADEMLAQVCSARAPALVAVCR